MHFHIWSLTGSRDPLLWVSEYLDKQSDALLSDQEIKVCLPASSLPLDFDVVQICILWLKPAPCAKLNNNNIVLFIFL